MGDVGGVGIHHDLHHAKPRYQPTPKGLAGFQFSALAGKHIIGRHSAVTAGLHCLHPHGGQDLGRRPNDLGPMAGGTNLSAQNTGNPAQRVFDSQ